MNKTRCFVGLLCSALGLFTVAAVGRQTVAERYVAPADFGLGGSDQSALDRPIPLAPDLLRIKLRSQSADSASGYIKAPTAPAGGTREPGRAAGSFPLLPCRTALARLFFPSLVSDHVRLQI